MRMARLLAASCLAEHRPDASPQACERVNLDMILATLDMAAAYRPDFVCLPEICLHVGHDFKARVKAVTQTIPGPASDAVAQRARTINANVLHCALERDGDRVYNTAALIGRTGEIIGKYRKYQPTGYEMADGVSPGESVPVWHTDRGNVGAAICFDVKFPEVALQLARGDARIAFFPTMFLGGHRLVTLAMDYGLFVVRCHASQGTILDPAGQTIATAGPTIPLQNLPARARFSFAEVNADHRTYHYDHHREKLIDIRRKYAGNIAIRDMADEGLFNLTSWLPDKTIEDIENEFELKPVRRYLDEAIAIRAERVGR